MRELASFFFRRPSRILQEINSNAMMVEWRNSLNNDIFLESRFSLYEYINTEYIGGGDFFEFGVFEGQSIFKWAELNACQTSRFFGFDSFQGLPENWDSVYGKVSQGTFDKKGEIPMASDCRIEFIKGLFQRSLRPFLHKYNRKGKIVVHLDCGIYSSTLYCLTTMDAHLPGKSILIFDEFYSTSHEFQAFMDYSKSHRRESTVLAATTDYEQVAIMLQ